MGELLKTVGPGVEAGVELLQVEADLGQFGPAVLAYRHVEGRLSRGMGSTFFSPSRSSRYFFLLVGRGLSGVWVAPWARGSPCR